LIIKPIDGSGSLGVRMVTSFAELAAVVSQSNGVIVQECIEGAEHTINVFVNRQGRCVCAVPHLRIEVRGGEVSKGVTVKNYPMMELASTIVESMPRAYGALNVQCFSTPAGDLKIIEINARFGGGYPLAHRAGAPVSRWLIEEILGREPQKPFDGWEDGLTMLRYDEAVFVPRAALQTDYHYAASVHRLRS
jgi:carbamoyl-phosphate synthase large subunit